MNSHEVDYKLYGDDIFASPYQGKIIPMDLSEFGGKVICQKDAF